MFLRPRSVVLMWLACAGACGDGARAPLRAGGGDLLPCDVAAILEPHCARCHGMPLRHGAPIALVRASDFSAERGGVRVATEVLARVTSDARPMPPRPAAPLSRAQVAVLRTFIDHGAKPDVRGCSVHSPAADDDGGADRDGAPPSLEAQDGGVLVGGTAASAWPMFGRDLGNTRANLDERALSPRTVSKLEPIWHYDGAATSSTPAVVDGVVYVAGWDGVVLALSARSGQRVWRTTLPNLVDSSLAVTATQVFAADGRGVVHALDRRNGKPQWSQPVDAHAQAHLWSSPIYLAEQHGVVVGVASSEEVVTDSAATFRGSVVVLDAEDGRERWRFYTTAGDAHEGAGVAVWATVSIDPQRKALYVGTGNNYAAPGSALSDSLLALDLVSGTRLWSFQFLPDDIFSLAGAEGPDYDVGSSANLFSADGKDLVGVGVKSGVYAAFDRDSGKLAWKTQVSPGGIFGGLISAPAYAKGLIFAASNDAAADQTIATALDAASGDVVWRHALDGQCFSGVAYANGVVYVGTMSGTIAALDAENGKTLWSDRMPDVAGSPAIADGMLLVTWGYQLALADGQRGSGGLIAYALPQ